MSKQTLERVSSGCLLDKRFDNTGTVTLSYTMKVVGDTVELFNSADCTGTSTKTSPIDWAKTCQMCPNTDCKASDGKFKKESGTCIYVTATTCSTSSDGFPVACNRLLLSSFFFFATICCM
jgi:hypothetical protein